MLRENSVHSCYGMGTVIMIGQTNKMDEKGIWEE
jgi:hypothetical protein